MEDNEIVALFWQRDQRAITVALKKYGKLCENLASGILGNGQDAEECVSDAYMAAWNAIPPERPTRFGAWICKVTRNMAINRYNRDHAQKRYQGTQVLLSELSECLPAADDPQRHLEGEELTSFLDKWLSCLSQRERWLFLRRYWYGQQIGEIAEELGEVPQRISREMYKLRLKLKKYLEKEGYTI